MRIRTQHAPRFVFLPAAGLIIAVAIFAHQSELPPGPGQEQVQKICSGCHSFSVFTQSHATRDKWAEVVDSMVARGAEGTDEDLEKVVTYLAAHFGPNAAGAKIYVNSSTAAELSKAFDITSQEAGAIVGYREKHGNFKDLEQLESIPGADRKKIEAHKDQIAF